MSTRCEKAYGSAQKYLSTLVHGWSGPTRTGSDRTINVCFSLGNDDDQIPARTLILDTERDSSACVPHNAELVVSPRDAEDHPLTHAGRPIHLQALCEGACFFKTARGCQIFASHEEMHTWDFQQEDNAAKDLLFLFRTCLCHCLPSTPQTGRPPTSSPLMSPTGSVNSSPTTQRSSSHASMRPRLASSASISCAPTFQQLLRQMRTCSCATFVSDTQRSDVIFLMFAEERQRL